MSENSLLDMMLKRRSVREYSGEKVPMESLNLIIEAGLAAPSSRGRKSCELIVVRDKQTLISLSGRRKGAARMLAGADACIVVLGDEELSDVWTEDCSIAMASMHLMASSLGVGSCWIQGRLREALIPDTTAEDYVRGILKFPSTLRLEAILSLGMPAEAPEPHTEEELRFDRVHIGSFMN